MGGEQDDVARARGGVAVLLVGHRVAGLRTTEAATSVGARSSFGGRLRPGGLLERRERLRAEHAEAPRVGQVVVRRPARELEQLVERRAVDGRRRVGLVRAAGADQVGEVHAARG